MDVDWTAMWMPKIAIVELILRGTIMYLALFALFRVVVRRQMGSLSLTDLLLIVLIADAAQNALAGDYRSIPEGLVLCATMIGWNYLLDWLSYRSPTLRRWLEPPALPLIKEGRMQRRNMRSELVTEEELMSHLRQQGATDPKEVQSAFLEPDGTISVIKYEGSKNEQHRPTQQRRRGAV
jgi:uncharacterized membrane protein YcaP (DUF421 family)